MWESFKGFLLLSLIVLLSLVFALQFGGGQAEGCAAGGTSSLAKVYGQTLSKGDHQASMSLLTSFLGRVPQEQLTAMRLPAHVLDGMIDRELLAHEAQEVGLSISRDEVMKKLVKDGTVRLTLGTRAPGYLPQGELPFSFEDKDGSFNKDYFTRYVQNGLRRTVSEFEEWQARETLAERMRELISSAVSVSDGEVWDAYLEENDRAQIKFARFSPSYYQQQGVDVSDARVRAWMTKDGNDARLEEAYEQNKHRYTDLEPQVQSRHILIKAPPNADEEAKKAARTKAEKLRARAVAGEDFAKLASASSEDVASAAKGGDLGFNPRGRMVEAFDNAQFDLKVGAISEVVETPFGFHVIKVEAKREGDVPKEDAKRELAERLYREDSTDGKARSAATALLKAWRDKDDDAIQARLEANANDEALAPKLDETGLFGRTDNPVPGLPAAELIEAVFALKEGQSFPASPVKVGREWLAFKLVDRKRPDEEAYDSETKAEKREVLRAGKEREALTLFLKQLRDRAEAAGALRINAIPAAGDGQS